MADDGFVTAVDGNGDKRRVPAHYLDNPRMGYKLPPSTRAKTTDKQPAKPEKTKEG